MGEVFSISVFSISVGSRMAISAGVGLGLRFGSERPVSGSLSAFFASLRLIKVCLNRRDAKNAEKKASKRKHNQTREGLATRQPAGLSSRQAGKGDEDRVAAGRVAVRGLGELDLSRRK
jgi:hypothetical protein